MSSQRPVHLPPRRKGAGSRHPGCVGCWTRGDAPSELLGLGTGRETARKEHALCRADLNRSPPPSELLQLSLLKGRVELAGGRSRGSVGAFHAMESERPEPGVANVRPLTRAGNASPPAACHARVSDVSRTWWHLRFLSLLGLSLLAACSPLRVAETLAPSGHLTLVPDITYGSEPRQRLDVYRPRRSGQSVPTIVFLYGGRWQDGSKRDYRLLGNTLTRRGFVVVVPDYRLYPEVRFPAWVEDGARAVRWTHDNIHTYGGDAAQIYVIGHSAGAHTAALLALDEEYLQTAGVPAGAVRGFVSLAGPVDTTWTAPDVQALMGPPDGWHATYPVNHIQGTEPPLLLLHGARDETVGAENSARLAAHIRAQGGQVRSTLYPGVGHVGIVIALIAPWLRIAPVLSDVETFIREQALTADAAARLYAVSGKATLHE